MDYLLDTRDYRCPLPLLMVKQALLRLTAEDKLSVLLSVDSDLREIQQLCEMYLCHRQYEADQTLIIRKR